MFLNSLLATTISTVVPRVVDYSLCAYLTLFVIKGILAFIRGGASDGHILIQRGLRFADIANPISIVVNYV